MRGQGSRRMDDLLHWRQEFPILERATYLISNSLGAMPRAVYDGLRDYADLWNTRGVRAWEEGWWEMAARGADEGGNLVADARGHLPPAFFPSADPARVPEVGIIAQPVIDRAGHGAEGIADQIGGALEDGEFLAPVEKIIHSAGSLPAHTCRRDAIASGMMPPVASV